MKIFSVKDIKANAHIAPMTMRTAAEAIRSFEQECKNPESNFFKFPTDYILLELSDWDEREGKLTPHQAPIILGTASEFVTKPIQ